MSPTLVDVCRVSVVSQDRIEVEVLNATAFKHLAGRSVAIGSFLRIADEDDHSVIAVVNAYRIKDPVSVTPEAEGEPRFVIEAQPVGFLTAAGEFKRGGQHIAIPPTRVTIA